MAFQSRFRETERHAFGERGGAGGDAAPGEPSEVRNNAISQNCKHTQPRPCTKILSPETSPNYKIHAFSLCSYS